MDRNLLLNDPETAQRYALDGRQAMMWTAMPAIVTKVNLSQMTLEVQPAIKGVMTDDEQNQTFVNLPQLVDCPICFPSAGGFTLTLPIAIGDEVLVIIASRCIDAWWQNGGIQQPMELRMHDLSDGFAIPGPRSLPRVVPAISATNAQLRNNAGTAFIEISNTGKINILGDLTVTGSIAATGEVTAKSLTTPKLLSTHVHTGVTTGSGDTGPPL